MGSKKVDFINILPSKKYLKSGKNQLFSVKLAKRVYPNMCEEGHASICYIYAIFFDI